MAFEGHRFSLSALVASVAMLAASVALAADEAIAAADTLLLTVPNQLGVDYNAHAINSILKFVAPELGWR